MRFGEFALECYEIFRSRNGVYRNAFEKMPAEAIIAFIIGKAHRVKALFEVDGAREKILDDLKDIANYCFMLMAKENDALSFGDFMLMCFLEREDGYEGLSADQLIEKMIETADKLRENNGSSAPKKLAILAYLLAARTQPPSPFSSGRGNAEKYA
ncbi:MAG: nucleotide modification associated domain-containing protein [Nitrososphaerota archaeon]